jgi:hypothetical protein
MVNALKSTSVAVRGVRYELEGAAHLIRNGDEVVEVSRKFLPGLRGGTDFDIVVLKDGKELFYQLKSTRSSFRSPLVDNTVSWISKVGESLKITAREAITGDRIRFVVPNLGDIPPSLRNANGTAIAIKDLPDIPVQIIPITP